MANLMGFKRVSRMPSPKGRSIYDPLLDEVLKTGGLYALDVEDGKRAHSLACTIRTVIKKRGYSTIVVCVRGTFVCVQKR